MSGEPKLVYVKMIYRPRKSNVQALRNIFNDALEDELVKHKNHFILNIRTKQSAFDHANFLTDAGAEAYWEELDKQIEMFDNNNDILKPILQEDKQPKEDNSSQQYRLPPPPPACPHHYKSGKPTAKRHLSFEQR